MIADLYKYSSTSCFHPANILSYLFNARLTVTLYHQVTMKCTLLTPILLSSTAFAGAGRWKRQGSSPTTTTPTTTTVAPSSTTSYEFTICRDARDCLSGERCDFQTLNGAHNGYNGICRPENYSYVPPPQPTPLGPCVGASDRRNDEFCAHGIYDANGNAQDGHCTSNKPDGPCSFNYNCQATQYCNAGKCTDYQDCRGQFCSPPVGETALQVPNRVDSVRD
jgi:hypothetical protein